MSANSGKKRVVVVGGGIIGVTTAYALAKKGFAVHIVEKCAQASMKTSYSNAGFLCASVCCNWATIENVKKLSGAFYTSVYSAVQHSLTTGQSVSNRKQPVIYMLDCRYVLYICCTHILYQIQCR